MDAPTFVFESLQQAHVRLQASCDGLSDAQTRWRPSPRSNSIGFILWHVGRVEDELVAAETETRTLWGQTWATRFGHAVDTPARDEREILLGLTLPPLNALRAFLAETNAQCHRLIDTLGAADFDRPSRVWVGQPLAVTLRHLATHKNNHHGQVDYLRGLQDDGWDLPRGTGAVLDN